MLGVGAIGSLEKSRELDAAVRAVEAYYQRVPMGGGWNLVEVKAMGGKVADEVSLPLEQAGTVQEKYPEDQRNTIARVVCPGKAIWDSIGKRDIVIHPIIAGGAVVENVSCRSWSHLYGI